MKYINKGICIFCKRDSNQTSFTEKAHTMPKSLGSESIGVDICNECNHYFGEPDLLSTPNLCIEVCVKEIFGLTKHLLECEKGLENKKLKSRYFEFWKSKNKIVIKNAYKCNFIFQKTFVNQFKRGLYEMFLQEFHKETGKGLEHRFDAIRNFARYNEGNIPLYHLQDNGVILTEQTFPPPQFRFTDKQFQNIDTYGFYTLILYGKWFFMEVTPQAIICREEYLKKAEEIIGSGFSFNRLVEVSSIQDIDFLLQKLYGG
ncbi:MAG: HNH endonuclease [Bacteroidales bacterium]